MINLSKVKLTPAQTIMIHTGESLVLSLVSSLLIGIIQYTSTNGLNWPGLGATAGTIFLGSMLMTYKSFQSNPNFAPALFDSLDEIKSLVEQQTPTIAPSPPAPPMNITIHTASTPPAVTATSSTGSDTPVVPTVMAVENVAASTPISDPYKSPEQVQQVPFPAQQLAQSFAFGTPVVSLGTASIPIIPTQSSQIVLNGSPGTTENLQGRATSEDTMPRSAKGK